MRLYSSVTRFLLPAVLTVAAVHADPLKTVNSPRMDWFKDAKFGLMIHWGMYAVPAGYWSKDRTFDSWHHADESGLEQISGYAEQVMKNAQMRPEEYNKIAGVFDWQEDGTHPHGYQHVKGPDAGPFQTYFENKLFPQVKELMPNFVAKGGDAPVWTFDVPESGEYSVSILYAAHPNLAKDKKNDIQIDGKTLLGFATRATKGASQDPWRNFEAHEIGRISIETGRRTLAIVPQPNQSGRNLTIKHISLTKVD